MKPHTPEREEESMWKSKTLHLMSVIYILFTSVRFSEDESVVNAGRMSMHRSPNHVHCLLLLKTLHAIKKKHMSHPLCTNYQFLISDI